MDAGTFPSLQIMQKLIPNAIETEQTEKQKKDFQQLGALAS